MADPATSTTVETEAPILISRSYQVGKRLLDLFLAILTLLPVGLLIMVVGILIWLDSSGPILLRQQRIGAYGRQFRMFKFRSMYHNVDDALHRQAIHRYMAGQRISHGPASAAPFKLSDDPRITCVGRFIRRTSLDELPQVLNVLLGQMSFVGPRPPLPYEVERYTGRARRRLEGKPGITGPWQVYGRSRVTFDEMVEMDVDYLKRQSLAYDVKLLLATVPAVLAGNGAG